MNRDDMQVQSSKVDLIDGLPKFPGYLGNAASGSNYGLELEAAWQVNDTINLYGSLGLLDTEFNDYITADGLSLSGEEQAHAPNYQFNIGVNYQPTDEWLFNISLDGKDEFYFSDTRHYDYNYDTFVTLDEPIPEQDIKSTTTVLLNASISYMADNWQVKLWGRNLTDEVYANRAFYFGNDPRDVWDPKQYTLLSEPLVFGVTLDYQF